ncbi:unnamed protein product [Ilex paraguariensis]|uniref:TRF2/HOY1 PH-like domain-containing protein n=1 Tax=Ilex paraguariensis TaxID=185542 RepID=A0ABC8S9Y5_9AQUA
MNIMVQGLGYNGIVFSTDKNGGFGGFSASEEFQSPPPLFDSVNSQSNVCYQSSEEVVSKRIRLSPEFNLQEEEINSSEQSSPLGLTLRKTPSFLNFLEMKLSQSKKSNCSTQIDDFLSQPMPEKLKASNFPASLLRIGFWERISRHEGDLVAKCYYAKRKLVWEVLEGALKSKIEIQWTDILAIRAIIRDNEPGILEIELNQPPLFFQETIPQPRKHTLWKQGSDFTGGQAPICRRHYVMFPPGALDKHYEKLLQCDQRLLMLSQRPFPSQESPYFHSNIYRFTEFSIGFNGRYPAASPEGTGLQHEFANFPAHLVLQPHVQNFKPMPRSPLSAMHSDSPMSVMDFSHMEERARNYTFENPGTGYWGNEGGINIPTQESSAIALAANGNTTSLCQNYNVLNHGEVERLYTQSTGRLMDIAKYLLDDSQGVCSDERKRLETESSLIELQGVKPIATNHVEYAHENDHLKLDSTEQSGVDNEQLCPNSISWLPLLDPQGSMMTYPNIFSEQIEEEFAALDSTQEIVFPQSLRQIQRNCIWINQPY